MSATMLLKPDSVHSNYTTSSESSMPTDSPISQIPLATQRKAVCLELEEVPPSQSQFSYSFTMERQRYLLFSKSLRRS
jgi:hypothetical protein